MAVTVYFDESGTHEGSARLMVAAVATLDSVALESRVGARKAEVLADSSLWVDQAKRATFAIDGFHHSLDDETVRDRLLETMKSLGFRAYVAYSGRTLGNLTDEDLLVLMYYNLVRNLLQRFSGIDVELIFEEKSELNPFYGRLVKRAIEDVQRLGVPLASSVCTSIGAKPLGGLAVADYVMAQTETHIRLTPTEGSPVAKVEPFRIMRFDRIQPHVAHVIDFDGAAHTQKLARML